MFTVYIIYSEKFDKYYTGQTSDFSERLKRHNADLVKSTKLYIPYKLIWLTQKETRKEAMALERKIKNLKSGKRLRRFMEKYHDENL